MSQTERSPEPAAAPDHYSATLVPAWGVASVPHLEAFLPECARLVRAVAPLEAVDSIAGWGFNKPSRYARFLARRLGLPYLAIEDGFLRSVGLGRAGAPPLSLVMDDVGVHYDARGPSRLEWILREGDLDDPRLIARGRTAMTRIIQAGLSKTNAAPPAPAALPPRRGRRILVVDQTLGDASIVGAMADAGTFARMLQAARDEAPDAEIVVRRHPAVSAGFRRGCLPMALPNGVVVADTDCRPADLLREVDAVYTVSSLLGFEALIRGLPVRCFGLPFYAGWGVTTDELTSPRRGRERTVEQIFAAACIRYARYVDPLTGKATTIETAIDRLIAFRDAADRHAGFTAALGFAPWKHGAARTLLYSPRGRVRFYSSAAGAVGAAERHAGRVVFWAGRETPEITAELAASAAPVLRMEDGFIRSRGLGSDFHPAASAVLDDLGVYYDATGSSRLEVILETEPFPSKLLARSAALRAKLVSAGLSKYNLGKAAPAVNWPTDRIGLLVVGQVENDKSLEKGCEDVASNLALLEATRRDHPEAFIAFKPHPDVEAGNRPGAVPVAAAASLADALVADADIATCLDQADGLATMTSLAGFEALLRGKTVFTYGRPFYAGWGLTTDALTNPRRRRRRSLDELVAGVLLLYPLYVDPQTGLPCEPEHLVDTLIRLREIAPAEPSRRARYLRVFIESLHPASRARY